MTGLRMDYAKLRRLSSNLSATVDVLQPLYRVKGENMIKEILIWSVVFLCVVCHVYELRHETEEDKRKKMWMFDHGFY